jgi:hypothetical protein
VAAAAGRAGLAYGAFAAEATLAAARGVILTPDALLREVLGRLDRAMMQARRIGVNLNQAVAALNTTGQPGETLLPCAAESMRRTARLEAITDDVRAMIRSVLRPCGPRRTAANPPSGPRSALADSGSPRPDGRTAGPGRSGPGSGLSVH